MNVPFGVRLAMAIAMPLLIVNRGYKMKSLSFSGACSSLVVGFLFPFPVCKLRADEQMYKQNKESISCL